MKLVVLNAGADTAGCGIGLKRAFDRHAPGWETRAVCRQGTYLSYPTDIVWPHDAPLAQTREIVELVRAADVVHVMDHEYALWPFRHVLRRKSIVVHHLGTNFRRNPSAVSAYCQRFGASQVTDSLDLLYPHVGWLPVTTDLEAIAALRTAYRPSGRIRIAHAPTNRLIKSTELIMATVGKLAERYPIAFDLIERVSNRECLERKAQADIFVDELTFGFGLNAIECWALGVPVVSGLADPDARRKALDMWGRFPWADATADTLSETIERLIVDPPWRTELAEIGRAHAERWHSERAVVDQVLAVYRQAGARIAA